MSPLPPLRGRPCTPVGGAGAGREPAAIGDLLKGSGEACFWPGVGAAGCRLSQAGWRAEESTTLAHLENQEGKGDADADAELQAAVAAAGEVGWRRGGG